MKHATPSFHQKRFSLQRRVVVVGPWPLKGVRKSEIWVNCSALNKAFRPCLFKVQRIPYKERKKECKSKNKRGERVWEMLFSRQKEKNRKEKKRQCKEVFICLFTFWKGNRGSENAFKRRSSRWAPIQNDRYLEKKKTWAQKQPNPEKRQQRDLQEGSHVTRGRDWLRNVPASQQSQEWLFIWEAE